MCRTRMRFSLCVHAWICLLLAASYLAERANKKSHNRRNNVRRRKSNRQICKQTVELQNDAREFCNFTSWVSMRTGTCGRSRLLVDSVRQEPISAPRRSFPVILLLSSNLPIMASNPVWCTSRYRCGKEKQDIRIPWSHEGSPYPGGTHWQYLA